ncbi:neuralized-like protein 2 [Brevipalpus obovatus]|uniref:neuralized-like protein 2 n=1 Tax=Brevipalpus obovatus TaxID=246614 RepID=UPI003D9E2D5A
MIITRFHPYHGKNIELQENQTVARRTTSFGHAITFSEKPLLPNQLFMLEIEQIEPGWSGHIKLGLTLCSPDEEPLLPQYAVPDMINTGRSWIFAVPGHVYHELSPCYPSLGSSLENFLDFDDLPRAGSSSYENSRNLPTSRKRSIPQSSTTKCFNSDHSNISRSHPSKNSLSFPSSSSPIPNNDRELDNTDTWAEEQQFFSSRTAILPTDVGSKIGVLYKVKGSHAEMHFIVNGLNQRVFICNIPYKQGLLYAVADIYGTTKQVRIVQMHSMPSLFECCLNFISRHVNSPEAVKLLPLPGKLKNRLLYHEEWFLYNLRNRLQNI